jgi:cardiolipin synthase
MPDPPVMRCTTVLIACLLLLSPLTLHLALADEPDPSVWIYEVHPGGQTMWEHAILMNTGDHAIDLSNWTLSDGEGVWRLPLGSSVPSGERISISENATGFQTLRGRPPDILAEASGRFSLADKGDDLTLYDASRAAVDQLWYGDGSGPGPEGWTGVPVPTQSSIPWGRVLRRTGTEDTDRSSDWQGWTEPRCGWLEEVPSPAPIAANATTFVTPEGGWAALARAISTADEELVIALYDLKSTDLTAAIAERAGAGVRVRMLLEGQPVGASADDLARRDGLIAALVEEGVEVGVTAPHLKSQHNRPYRYHHEKCCVIDGRTVVVTTENWGPSSFPSSGHASGFASRGWGAVVESPEMATRLTEVIDHDLRVCTVKWESRGTTPTTLQKVPPSPAAGPSLFPCSSSLLVGPESWGSDLATLTDLIGIATKTIQLELASLEIEWGEQVSPLVDAVLDAATRGVRVRLLLDPGFDGEGEATVRELSLLCAQRGIVQVTAAVADGIPGVARVHAKGAIIDGRVAILGSLNWAWSSATRNREVVLVLEGAEAVADLRRTFTADWAASTSKTLPRVPLTLIALLIQNREGGAEPTTFQAPVPTVSREGSEDVDIEEGLPWPSIGRTVLVMSLVGALWALDRHFKFSMRATLRLKLGGRKVIRRFRRLIHRSGVLALPGVLRTICQVGDLERGPPQDPPPGPGPGELPVPPEAPLLGPGAAEW